MNREDVIRMAREAGFETDCGPLLPESASIKVGGLYVGVQPLLERFAALVAAHALANIDPSKLMSYQEGYEAGAAAEREACAKLCESLAGSMWVTREASLECSDAIRARGEEK